MSKQNDKQEALDDIFYGRTPETRLLNGVYAVATREGKFSQFSMTNQEKGWKHVEFWWKPENESDAKLGKVL